MCKAWSLFGLRAEVVSDLFLAAGEISDCTLRLYDTLMGIFKVIYLFIIYLSVVHCRISVVNVHFQLQVVICQLSVVGCQLLVFTPDFQRGVCLVSPDVDDVRLVKYTSIYYR